MEVTMFINNHYEQAEYLPCEASKDATHRSPYNRRLYKVTGDKVESWCGCYGWVTLMTGYAEETMIDLVPLTGNPSNRYCGTGIDDYEVKYYECTETKNLYKLDELDCGRVLFSLRGLWTDSTFEAEELEDETLFKRLNLRK